MTPTPRDLDDVHAFWFGELTGPDHDMAEKQRIWFGQDDGIDTTIRNRFGALIAPAAEADWDLASLTPAQQVGLVVLLDQFPRNIHRTSGEAFAYDGNALAITKRLMEAGTESFNTFERMFVFMPAMHSEAIDDQDRCVMWFAQEVVSAPAERKEGFRGGLDFAIKHRDLIRKFGRFPHRNEMLGRATTEEEAAFLAEQGRGF